MAEMFASYNKVSSCMLQSSNWLQVPPDNAMKRNGMVARFFVKTQKVIITRSICNILLPAI